MDVNGDWMEGQGPVYEGDYGDEMGHPYPAMHPSFPHPNANGQILDPENLPPPPPYPHHHASQREKLFFSPE